MKEAIIIFTILLLLILFISVFGGSVRSTPRDDLDGLYGGADPSSHRRVAEQFRQQRRRMGGARVSVEEPLTEYYTAPSDPENAAISSPSSPSPSSSLQPSLPPPPMQMQQMQMPQAQEVDEELEAAQQSVGVVLQEEAEQPMIVPANNVAPPPPGAGAGVEPFQENEFAPF